MHAPNTSTALVTTVPTRWTLRREEVEQAAASLPPKEGEALLWIDSFARKQNLTLAQLGGRLEKEHGGCYSRDTVYQVLTGRETSIDKFVGAIHRFRACTIDSPRDFPFVETSVWRAISGYADLCIQYHKMGLLIGESQTGKSRAFKEKARRLQAEGRTVVYIQMPVGGHKSKVIFLVADALGVSTHYNAPKLELLIEKAVTPETIFFFDEIQQCDSRSMMGGRTRTERVDTIEYIRRLRDVCGCPVIMSGTTEALHMLKGEGIGHTNRHIFIQTLKRALDPCELKNDPPRKDLNAFASLVELPPAVGEALEVQDDVVRKRGLEIWLTYLLAGFQRATNDGEKPSWSHVLKAYETFVPRKVKEIPA